MFEKIDLLSQKTIKIDIKKKADSRSLLIPEDARNIMGISERDTLLARVASSQTRKYIILTKSNDRFTDQNGDERISVVFKEPLMLNVNYHICLSADLRTRSGINFYKEVRIWTIQNNDYPARLILIPTEFDATITPRTKNYSGKKRF